MKMINMALAITLFAASYANASTFLPIEEDEAEDPASEMAAGVNSIFDTINGAVDNFKDMAEAAESAQDTLDAATQAYNNQYHWGELAPSLTSGQCGMLGTCSECRMSERKKGPLMRDYRCKDRTAYQYGKACNDEQLSSVNLCQTEDASLCHISYQVSDWRKAGSEFAACRTVPVDYTEGQFEYSQIVLKNHEGGLCGYGCEEYDNEERCAWSWPEGESKWLNPKAMFRCVPKDD